VPPKVLHYLDTENYAGTEAHVLTLLRSLDRDLYSPALLCRPSTVLHERAQAAGIPCYPGGNLADMVRLLRQERFALIHAHDGNSKLHAVLAARLARTGTHVVATQHFVQPAYTQRGGWKGRVAKSIHHAVNGLVAASGGYNANDQAAVDQALPVSVFTLGPARTTEILSHLPYLVDANAAAQNANAALSFGCGNGGCF